MSATPLPYDLHGRDAPRVLLAQFDDDGAAQRAQ
jgi:hypothetical protein